MDLFNQGTAILKDDPIWKTMSMSAGIDAILLFHVCNPKQATEKLPKNHSKNKK